MGNKSSSGKFAELKTAFVEVMECNPDKTEICARYHDLINKSRAIYKILPKNKIVARHGMELNKKSKKLVICNVMILYFAKNGDVKLFYRILNTVVAVYYMHGENLTFVTQSNKNSHFTVKTYLGTKLRNNIIVDNGVVWGRILNIQFEIRIIGNKWIQTLPIIETLDKMEIELIKKAVDLSRSQAQFQN